jgi:mannose-6-phosphate isomerase-like protein (cupin superfamily)
MSGNFAPSIISEHVRKKIPRWGTTPVQWTWEEALQFLDTHPDKLIDHHPDKMRFFLKNSHKRPSSPQFAKEVVSEMESVFTRNKITNIAFMGFGANTDSYPWHKDIMDVFLVQVFGEISIRVENTDYETTPRIFRPGDCVYIPRGTHHQIIAGKSRVTFSFGVERNPDPSTYL